MSDDLVISEKLIFNGLEGGFENMIYTAGEKLQELGIVKSSYPEAVIIREKEYPTGLEGVHGNFAIPHTYSEHCIGSALSIIRPPKPLQFVRMDDHSKSIPCGLIVLLAIDKPEKQLSMLRKLMRAMQDVEIFHILESERSSKAVVETLRKICL